MKSLCIIPARGGSKRIPGKNVKDFCGKPIIAYPIEAALKSGIFDEVMVSTDDEKIANIARQFGASVPFMRSEETANDFASTEAVHLEVLTEYEKRGIRFDYMCNIYPCTPMVTAEKLQECFNVLKSSGADCAQPMVRYPAPPQQAFHKDGDFMSFINPELAYERTQDLEPLYYDPGQYYFYNLSTFREKNMKTRTVAMIEISEKDAQDVDTPEDWVMAEIKYKLLHQEVLL